MGRIRGDGVIGRILGDGVMGRILGDVVTNISYSILGALSETSAQLARPLQLLGGL